MSSRPIELILAALLGRWSVRRRRGLSVLFLVLGALSCLMFVPATMLGAPFSWVRSREVAALARPEPEALAALAPGTQVLIVAQLPPAAPAGPHGLALFTVERRSPDSANSKLSKARESQLPNWAAAPPAADRGKARCAMVFLHPGHRHAVLELNLSFALA